LGEAGGTWPEACPLRAARQLRRQDPQRR